MKYYFLLLLIVIGVKGNCQGHPSLSNPNNLTMAETGHPKILELKYKSDTLEIFLPLAFHFIKIGTEVYQIIEHNPTIELVKPIERWQPGGIINFYNDSVMNLHFQPTGSTNAPYKP